MQPSLAENVKNYQQLYQHLVVEGFRRIDHSKREDIRRQAKQASKSLYSLTACEGALRTEEFYLKLIQSKIKRLDRIFLMAIISISIFILLIYFLQHDAYIEVSEVIKNLNVFFGVITMGGVGLYFLTVFNLYSDERFTLLKISKYQTEARKSRLELTEKLSHSSLSPYYGRDITTLAYMLLWSGEIEAFTEEFRGLQRSHHVINNNVLLWLRDEEEGHLKEVLDLINIPDLIFNKLLLYFLFMDNMDFRLEVAADLPTLGWDYPSEEWKKIFEGLRK